MNDKQKIRNINHIVEQMPTSYRDQTPWMSIENTLQSYN